MFTMRHGLQMVQQQTQDAFNAQEEVNKRLALLEHGHQAAVPEDSASQVGVTCPPSMASLLELSRMKEVPPRICKAPSSLMLCCVNGHLQREAAHSLSQCQRSKCLTALSWRWSANAAAAGKAWELHQQMQVQASETCSASDHRSGRVQTPMALPLQGTDEAAREGAELAPADKVAAARRVWELREQMTAQMAEHRKVSGALGAA